MLIIIYIIHIGYLSFLNSYEYLIRFPFFFLYLFLYFP